LILILSALNAHGQMQASMPYADPSQEAIPIYQYSYYLQPWKSYMDTWPGTQLTNCIGINFNPPSNLDSDATAQVLAQCGFKEARVEIGWGNFTYANPALMGSEQLASWNITLQAFKKWGLRPLILLNGNSSFPCPNVGLQATVETAAPVGAITITLESTAGIIPNFTGLVGQQYQVGCPLITSVNGATCTLSEPLSVAVPVGSIALMTLLYHPLSTGGGANPYSQATINGWATYVRSICTYLQTIFGNNFDLEVWNEYTFGSQFLDDDNYYSPVQKSTGTLSYSNHGFTRTGVEVLEPIAVDIAASYPGVRVIDGFSNQRPWDAGSTMWPGEYGFSRHFYTGIDTTDAFQGREGVSKPPMAVPGGLVVLNALGELDSPVFVPSFTMSCPESMWMGTEYVYMIRDVQPFPSLFPSNDLDGHETAFHWRGSANLLGQTAHTWETETNCSRGDWTALLKAQLGIAATDQNLINLSHFIGAKALLRLYTFYAHKGLETACVYAASGGDLDLSVIPDAFFAALAKRGGAYSSAAPIGKELQSIKNLTDKFNDYAVPIFKVRPLTVTGLSEPLPRIEFLGDGTIAHPTRYNVDDFGVFPFQLNQQTYAVGYYVVTRNIVQNWGVTPNILDVSNYRMPDETFDVTIAGMANGLSAHISSFDPLNNIYTAVTVLARSQDAVRVRVSSSDYPRFLLVSSRRMARRE